MFSHSLASCVEMSPSYRVGRHHISVVIAGACHPPNLDEEILRDSPLLPAAQHHAREGGRSPR